MKNPSLLPRITVAPSIVVHEYIVHSSWSLEGGEPRATGGNYSDWTVFLNYFSIIFVELINFFNIIVHRLIIFGLWDIRLGRFLGMIR